MRRFVAPPLARAPISAQLDYLDYPWLVVMSARSQSEFCMDFCFPQLFFFRFSRWGRGSRASFCGRVQVVVRRVRLRSCRRHRIAGANLDRSSDCTFDVVVRRVNKFNCTTVASRSSISVHQLSVEKVGVAILYTIQMSFLHVTRRAAKPTIYSSLLVVDGVALVGISACV